MASKFSNATEMSLTINVARVARAFLLSSLAVALLAIGHPAEARITRMVIETRTSPAFGGASFGNVGQYEQLTGVAYGEVDPKDSLNAVITDIELAPRNSRGMVEYSMDFAITKPIDMSRANGTLLYDVPNRGNIRSPELNVGGNATNVGDGFLQREGYTLVDSGWEGDVTSGLQIRLPIAKHRDGREIRGRVRSEYILGSPASTQDVTEPPAYEAISTDNSEATLTRRVHQNDPRELIPNSQWAFADCTSVAFPGVPDPTKICLQGGFDTNHIYELVYTAKNPMVVGLGFAATRDFVSFLRSGNRGGLVNPLGDGIENAIIYGSSQSGRWIRTFIQLGFNQDEHRRKVFEGAIPHKASNRGAFNIRFAQPTRLSGTQHSEQQYPGAESPQTWDVSFDPLSGIRAGQLERCRRTHTCPKITHTNTDTEYWQAVMSLNTTDSTGTEDLRIPPEVRIYDLAGTQHGGGNPLQQPPAVLPAFPNACQLRSNSNPFIHAQRALLVALREWIVNDTEPPPSLYSSIGRGSLVKADRGTHPIHPCRELHCARSGQLQGVPRSRTTLRCRGYLRCHGRTTDIWARLHCARAAGRC
jgi:Alpha/beta hydrolase domain